jgi:RNA polymerase sigma factor (sigma-70 family)
MKTINFAENNHVVRNENIDRYMSEANAVKAVSEDDIKALVIAAQNGNTRAREKAINANLRIVWSIAAHYNGMDNFEDILQNGNYGLCVAVDTFDVSRETKFSTWALEIIRKYINIGLTDESRVVRQSAHHVKAKKSYNATSFDAPIGNEDGEEKTLLDFFASDLSADNFSKVEDMRVKINYLLGGLKPIEKEIICGLFGFGCREYTQYELSRKFDYTEERIRQIKFEALEKMKKLG